MSVHHIEVTRRGAGLLLLFDGVQLAPADVIVSGLTLRDEPDSLPQLTVVFTADRITMDASELEDDDGETQGQDAAEAA